jgi:cytochrome d ubiquinol oxidase subunit II
MSGELSFWVIAAALLAVLALNAYLLLGGADFGGGIWDLLASGPRKARQRDAIAHAIGPVWEANHVWLIALIVILFTCFPPAFARITTVLHLPLSLMLIGIVLRGTAFTFRSYGGDDDAAQRRWGVIFSVASLFTPGLLGISVGAVSTGAVGAPAGPGWAATYLAPWVSAFPVAVGFLTVVLCGFLAATYLTAVTRGDLQEDFRRRALLAAGAVFVMAGVTLLLAVREARQVAWGLTESPWAVAVQGATGLSAVTAIVALWKRRYRWARLAAAGQATCMVWGWALSLAPALVPPELTLHSAAAPVPTLRATVLVFLGGAVLLIPALRYLFLLFGRAPEAEPPSGERRLPEHEVHGA